jgi:transcriptional regulator with XRE-family HTH domain
MIADQLKAALRGKKWSISEAASKSDVSRSFLSRLLSGQGPPRTRSGHQTAEHDERYRSLAETLDLPDPSGFIQIVAHAQQTQSAAPPVPEILRRRYPNLHQQIAKNQPLRNRADLLRLMGDCLGKAIAPQAERLKEEVLTRLKKAPQSPPFRTQMYVTHDYLGTPSNQRLSGFASTRTQACREIGEALIKVGDNRGDASVDACVEIAQLFYDLALLDH